MNESSHRHIALAAELEKEGQYNAAKLLRAAAIASLNRGSTRVEVPSAPADQASALEQIADELQPHQEVLAAPLRAAASALRSETVTTFSETPDPSVCRICGRVELGPFEDRCRDCGRWPTAAERFRAIYWLRASTPPEAIALLASTPDTIRRILESGDPDMPGPDGGWSARQTLEHLNNAQSLFRGRIDQLLEGGEPELASVMVWTMDAGSMGAGELFQAYHRLRSEIVDVLRDADPSAWWNVGHHEEFGTVTLAEQASYFANHEPTHLAQLADAAGGAD